MLSPSPMASTTDLHIAILSSPGIGHLTPILELAKRLIAVPPVHNSRVTVLAVTTATSPAETHLLRPPPAGSNINIIPIKPDDIPGLDEPGVNVGRKLILIMRAARPVVRSALAAMTSPPDMLVVDIFGTESFVIADEFRVPRYLYVASNAWYTAFTLYSPVLDREVNGEFVDQKEPLRIPGCRSVRPEEVVDPMLDRTDRDYAEYVRMCTEFGMSDGILMNTWEDLDPKSLTALRSVEIVKPQIYTIGPLVKPVEPTSPRSGSLEWLDRQPDRSVIYVSFGSGGTLSREQLTELAWGLELSRQRFIWVVRPPNNGLMNESFFISGEDPNHKSTHFLPDGFLTRTREVGVVMLLWAPQMEILSHPSVGGFMSHCGWNSTLESITNGVPIIAWPLYAEQRMNATLLTEELGVAIRPRVLPTKKVVGRKEIKEMVRTILGDGDKGMSMRENVKRLQITARNALSKDGSSYVSICKLVHDSNKLKSVQENYGVTS